MGTLNRGLGRREMSQVDRIERPAENTNPHG
jgi:hypothetical protein